MHVFVNGEEILATPSHPFYVPKFGWTKAINLRAGDILVLSNGEYVVVEAIQHEILESPILSQLKGDYGMPSVPVGYVVHHDFNNGIL